MASLPEHVAIIMDGNGRWATARHLRRVAGHRAGVLTVRKIIEHAVKRGIKVLTLFAFSLENRRRPPLEVRFLMKLMSVTLQREIHQLHANQIRLKVIGDRSYLDASMRRQIEEAEALTEHNTGLTLVMSIHYSGRWDIAQAVIRLLQSPASLEGRSTSEVEALLRSHLALGDVPDPDLLIRTSGEQRVSNFMLWQLAYTEMFFSDLYWPDFTEQEFDRALHSYQHRERRFGLTSEQVSETGYA